jgi:uncharacterized integral membrane protein (TIGR00698 family)
VQLSDLRFWKEVLLATILAVFAAYLADFPGLDHFGGISLALIIGMLWKALFWKSRSGFGGLEFASKTLLRLGIVVLGTRLNFAVLAHAGLQVVAFDLLMIVLGIGLITFLLRRAGFEPTLATLAAVGSSICGASAIAATAPAVGANKENSALAIVVCTLVGTVATFLLIPLQALVGLEPQQYGILAGSTLHEVAQVVAAVAPVPDAFQTGMVTKLLRVVFLAPVVAILPRMMQHSVRPGAPAVVKPSVVPWYVTGFLITGLLVTATGFLPDSPRSLVDAITKQLVQPTNLLIGTSMAAIGLQVDFEALRKHGLKLIVIAGGAWLILFSAVFALCFVWR